jgi:hypothetical protein
MAMKINTGYIKQEIPNLMTQAEFDELCEVWDENMGDYDDDDDDPEIVAMKKIDFPKYVKVGKNWKRVHKSKIGSDIHRVFELGPGPVFEGIFKMEIITDGTDSTILHTSFYNE